MKDGWFVTAVNGQTLASLGVDSRATLIATIKGTPQRPLTLTLESPVQAPVPPPAAPVTVVTAVPKAPPQVSRPSFV